jgi:sodium/bile acid cotransporter 2
VPEQAAQVDLKEFRQRFNKPIGIIIGLVCQFVFLPVAGFASIRIFFPDNPVYGRSPHRCRVLRV